MEDYLGNEYLVVEVASLKEPDMEKPTPLSSAKSWLL
jgi:hypothetical protein